MGTQRSTQMPFDAALQLDDGATPHAAGATVGTVGGVSAVFDIMAGAPGLGTPTNVETIRYGGTLVVDLLAITGGSDTVTLEGSVDAAFTTPYTLASTLALTATGVAHAPFQNSGGGALLRYLRVKHTVATGPATAIAFLAPYNAEGY